MKIFLCLTILWVRNLGRACLNDSSALCGISWRSFVCLLSAGNGWARLEGPRGFHSFVWHLDNLPCGLPSPGGILSSRGPPCVQFLQQDVLNSLTAWWLGSESESESCQAWNWHVIVSATFCGQSKSQAQPKFKGREICSQLLTGIELHIWVYVGRKRWQLSLERIYKRGKLL